MDIFATDIIYVVDVNLLTIDTFIVDNVVKGFTKQMSYVECTNEKNGTVANISTFHDFNLDLNSIAAYNHHSNAEKFSFTDPAQAKKALIILTKRELDEAEEYLEQHKQSFLETYDRVVKLQGKYNSLKKL